MKKVITLYLAVLGLVFVSNAEGLPDSVRYIKKPSGEINVKFNMLQMPIARGLPSVHTEVQVGSNTSLHFSAYYMDFVFWTRSQGIGLSAMTRYYAAEKNRLRGLYVGAGLDALYMKDFNLDRTRTSLPIGAKVAAGVKAGANSWVFDVGLGGIFYYEGEAQMTLMLGVGYKIRK